MRVAFESVSKTGYLHLQYFGLKYRFYANIFFNRSITCIFGARFRSTLQSPAQLVHTYMNLAVIDLRLDLILI